MITIDDETADRITLCVLKEHKQMTENQLKAYEDGGWMHEDDVKYYKKLVKSLGRVIRYFGGESHEW